MPSWRFTAAMGLASAFACAGCSSSSKSTEAVAASTTAPVPGVATTPVSTAGSELGPIREASFDDVKFPMEKTEQFHETMLTEKVRGMFNSRIRIRGYMYPTLRKRGLTQFVLVRDNLECCFGPGAALFDCVLVSMVPGQTAEYSVRPIAVEGTFRFDPLAGPDGRPVAIYQMIGEQVLE